jgi:hypothetical protein
MVNPHFADLPSKKKPTVFSGSGTIAAGNQIRYVRAAIGRPSIFSGKPSLRLTHIIGII